MADAVGWVAGPTERGTLSLVWSCLITIFACTWTVLHLNLPSRSEKPRTILLRKLKWMAINVLFPEFIFSKAICDLRLALHELLEFDAHLRSCRYDITWMTRDTNVNGLHGYDTKWSWKIELPGGWSTWIYYLLRLPRPPPPFQQCDENQANIASSSTQSLDEANISGPFNRLGTKDSASGAEVGQSSSIKTLHQSGQQSQEQGSQLHGPAVENHEHAEKEYRRSLDMYRAPSKERQLHSLNNDACKDLCVAAQGRCRSDIEETNLEKGLPMEDRHAVYPKTQITPSWEEIGSLPNARDACSEDYVPELEQKWTITHSYYAQMGGLARIQPITPSGRANIITASMLTRRYKWTWETNPEHEHPLKHLILGKEDIEDKSKADWFLKSLAVLQVAWIVLNVIVRHVTGLPITQLEVATAAFAIMAVLSYLANWWKPKDVSRQTLLYFRGHRAWSHKPQGYIQSFTQRLRAPSEAEITAVHFESLAPERRVENDFVWLEGTTPLLFYLMAGSSLLFGGLHCFAWDFKFPTRFELICWRAASVTSSVLPVVTLAISAVLGYFATSYAEKEFQSKWLAKLNSNFSDHSHADWFNLFVRPPFLAWNDAALCDLYLRPSGLRNWEEPSTTGDPNIHNKLGPDQEALFQNLCLFRQYLVGFSLLSRLPLKWADIDARYLLDSTGRAVDVLARHPHLLEFWRDYENFAKGKLPGPSPPAFNGGTATYLEAILDVTEEVAAPLLIFSKQCQQVSNAVFITSLILYAASRLIILVIVFTSLRAVPTDVYQDTAWTRFLPSFS